MRIVSIAVSVQLGSSAANYDGALGLWCNPGIRPRLIEAHFSSAGGASVSYQIRRVTVPGIPVPGVSLPLIAEDQDPDDPLLGPSGVWVTPSYSAQGITQTDGWAQRPFYGAGTEAMRRVQPAAVGCGLFSIPRGIAFSYDAPLMICSTATSTGFFASLVVAL